MMHGSRRFAGIVLVLSMARTAGAESPAPEIETAPKLPWAGRAGQGVALGLDVAGASTALEAQPSVLVPFGSLFALRTRGVLAYGYGDVGGVSIGGKFEGIVRSSVLLNFVRVYAGGGPALFYGVHGAQAKQTDGNWFKGDVDGNWFAGAEIFFDRRWSLRWETGTSGGALGSGSGAYTDAGVNAYLF